MKFYHDKLCDDISTNQLPIYAADQLVVDEKGNYKYTISLAGGRGNNFSIEKNKLKFILHGDPGLEYTIDLDERKVISEREIDGNESDDLFAMYSQLEPMTYTTGNKTYELKRNLFVLNKINISEGGKTKSVILKSIPKFPIIIPFWLGVITLSFWGLCLYTYIVLYRKK